MFIQKVNGYINIREQRCFLVINHYCKLCYKKRPSKGEGFFLFIGIYLMPRTLFMNNQVSHQICPYFRITPPSSMKELNAVD
ncbi:hypothetical protein [Clostridium ljungdahlii]|uniref:Uncharacterized protein n=1 Tax=Clostridium ljungdahlii (strain ATCC 55383 / DSM 13528 / PETC) TaxID=748727 RepID=A0ABX2TWK1_CLOLD|nr:hypothetical protein [Clostridium ljungdahlii]OAA88408.1 hypothetical protein WX45_02728 [Clostridium ljungdahlii DSM 13528]